MLHVKLLYSDLVVQGTRKRHTWETITIFCYAGEIRFKVQQNDLGMLINVKNTQCKKTTFHVVTCVCNF